MIDVTFRAYDLERFSAFFQRMYTERTINVFLTMDYFSNLVLFTI